MLSIGLSEIQKNIGVLSDVVEPIRIVDKKRNIGLATIIGMDKKRNLLKLGGVFKDKIGRDKKNIDFDVVREKARKEYFK